MEPVGQVSSSITSLMKEFRTITNNIANSSTTGFKRTVNSFSQELSEQQKLAGSQMGPEQLNAKIKNKIIYDLKQGILVKTDRSLDMSITGKGWFTVETEDGPLYTRNGVFFTNENGQIVDSQGSLIAGDAGPIIIPKDVPVNEISVGADGTVSYQGDVFGKFKIVEFGDDEEALFPAGGCRFRAPEDIRPSIAVDAAVQQGYLESSNVNITEELVDLMKVMRTYEANMKLLSKSSENSKAILEVAAS